MPTTRRSRVQAQANAAVPTDTPQTPIATPQTEQPMNNPAFDYVVFMQLFGAVTVVQFFMWVLGSRGLADLSVRRCVIALVKSGFLLAVSYQCVGTVPLMTIIPVVLNAVWLNFKLPAGFEYYFWLVYQITIVKTTVVTILWYDCSEAKMQTKKGMAVFMIILFVMDLAETQCYCTPYWTNVTVDFTWDDGTYIVLSTETEKMSLNIMWFLAAEAFCVACMYVLYIYGLTAIEKYESVRVMQVPEDILSSLVRFIGRSIMAVFTACVRWPFPTRGIDRTKKNETKDEPAGSTALVCAKSSRMNTISTASGQDSEDKLAPNDQGDDGEVI